MAGQPPLAPEIFDAAVVQRLWVESADRERLHAELDAAVAKVYGSTTDRSELHRSTNAAQCELWMTEARQSFARYQQFQPHRRVSLGLAVCREVEH